MKMLWITEAVQKVDFWGVRNHFLTPQGGLLGKPRESIISGQEPLLRRSPSGLTIWARRTRLVITARMWTLTPRAGF